MSFLNPFWTLAMMKKIRCSCRWLGMRTSLIDTTPLDAWGYAPPSKDMCGKAKGTDPI